MCADDGSPAQCCLCQSWRHHWQLLRRAPRPRPSWPAPSCRWWCRAPWSRCTLLGHVSRVTCHASAPGQRQVMTECCRWPWVDGDGLPLPLQSLGCSPIREGPRRVESWALNVRITLAEQTFEPCTFAKHVFRSRYRPRNKSASE